MFDVGIELPTKVIEVEISDAEFEASLDWVSRSVNTLNELRQEGVSIYILRTTIINQWNYRTPTETDSDFTAWYGTDQLVQPHFWFSTPQEFRWLKQVIRSTLSVTLNDKHIRPKGTLDRTA